MISGGDEKWLRSGRTPRGADGTPRGCDGVES